MSQLTIEERLQIVREVYLVIGNNKTVLTTNTPKIDSFFLTKAILEDKVYSCNNKHRLIGVLKKSPVWPKILPFIKNNDFHCARKGCSCPSYEHTGCENECLNTKRKWNAATKKYDRIPCKCPKFVRRTFT
jgi:hypothetical protein